MERRHAIVNFCGAPWQPIKTLSFFFHLGAFRDVFGQYIDSERHGTHYIRSCDIRLDFGHYRAPGFASNDYVSNVEYRASNGYDIYQLWSLPKNLIVHCSVFLESLQNI